MKLSKSAERKRSRNHRAIKIYDNLIRIGTAKEIALEATAERCGVCKKTVRNILKKR